jgi:hypothetical protein
MARPTIKADQYDKAKRALDAGYTIREAAKAAGLSIGTTYNISVGSIDRPRLNAAYRCPGCGQLAIGKPCRLCESRKTQSESRRPVEPVDPTGMSKLVAAAGRVA